MSRAGALRKLLTNFKNSLFATRQKTKFIGTDKYGNRYFEKEGDKEHNLRSSRFIEERKDLGPFDTPDVPVEWNAWLRGLRLAPPTPEEIEQNEIKMMKAKLRAAEIDRKYAKLTDTPSQDVPQVAKDIESNPDPKRTPFPTYEGFEISPGEKAPGGKIK